MKKKAYEKPEMKVVLMQYHTNILAGSPTPPETNEYGDWLGAPEFNPEGDFGWVD
jgi:hypothetical protein